MFNQQKNIIKILLLIAFLIGLIMVITTYESFRKEVVQAYPYHHQDHHTPSINTYPIDLINMVLAIEDQRFLQHNGVDFIQVFDAIKQYLFDNKSLRGASTISQQLIKNGLLSKQRTLKRKLTEALMAFILEKHFSKIQILEAYLDIVYLGQSKKGGIYGFHQAAYFYFKKTLNTLNLDEKAGLVALLKGASYYHPVHHKMRFDKRKKLVLIFFTQYQKYHGKYTRN